MNTRKRIALASAGLALGAGLATAPGAVASQKSEVTRPAAVQQTAWSVDERKASCAYPSVCFIKGGKTVAAYKDMGYQKLSAKAKSATSIHNSRKDDGARIYGVKSNGTKAWSCVKPKTTHTVNAGWKIYAIDIRNSPSCK
ncbi:hypothetical protein ACIOJD_04945 [Streptomyces sp. NPDC088116]|uniref:hypothetical protein n=1 Tax=Streptomyces sp. NPDC088116 TaxID=3365825 RepID=UPI0037F237D9